MADKNNPNNNAESGDRTLKKTASRLPIKFTFASRTSKNAKVSVQVKADKEKNQSNEMGTFSQASFLQARSTFSTSNKKIAMKEVKREDDKPKTKAKPVDAPVKIHQNPVFSPTGNNVLVRRGTLELDSVRPRTKTSSSHSNYNRNLSLTRHPTIIKLNVNRTASAASNATAFSLENSSDNDVPGFVAEKLFQDQELIGEGASAKVYKAKWMQRRLQMVALKKVMLKDKRKSHHKLFSKLRRSRDENTGLASIVAQFEADIPETNNDADKKVRNDKIRGSRQIAGIVATSLNYVRRIQSSQSAVRPAPIRRPPTLMFQNHQFAGKDNQDFFSALESDDNIGHSHSASTEDVPTKSLESSDSGNGTEDAPVTFYKANKGNPANVNNIRASGGVKNNGRFGDIKSASATLGKAVKRNMSVQLNQPRLSTKDYDALDGGRTKQEIKREIKIWNKLNSGRKNGHCAFIIELYDWIWLRNQCWLIMELCDNATLWTFVKDFSRENLIPFTMDLTVDLFAPILSAVRHMHTKGFIHRDIKPENILLTNELIPKLGDFGLCIEFDTEEDTDGRINMRALVPHSQSFDGTPSYAPPEAFFGYNFNSTWDSFSLMTTIFFMKFSKVCWDIGMKKWPDEKIADYFNATCKDMVYSGTPEDVVELEYLNEMHILPKNAFIKSHSQDDLEWTDERIKFGEFAQKCMKWNFNNRMTVSEMCDEPIFKDNIERWNADPLKAAVDFKAKLQAWIEDDTFIDDKWLIF